MKQALVFLWLAALLVVPPLAAAQERDMAALFPELEGWQKSGRAEVFMPANLYEHINGAAENFLAYGFAKLAVQSYASHQGQSMSAEIYFHGSTENAFGIYSSEKPLAGNYIQIGGQGYEEEGVLNFISDAYYVKLNGFDLGPQGGRLLKSLADKIAVAIHGRNTLPEILEAFPASGRIPHSERYIASNFLGHEFLAPAFTADYDLQGRKFQLFIMRIGDEARARAMLQRYASLDKKAAAAEIRPGETILNDPYNGPVRLCWQGIHVWGAIGPMPETTEYFAEIARHLTGR